ncbi:MAG TPA: LD-carboxypeptidase [Desulfobulbus sp.]|nr:LD-carboxypeptidase [Desulfobulbus sp.]
MPPTEPSAGQVPRDHGAASAYRHPVLLPPRLRPGDTIGIVLPAGPVRDPGRAEGGLRILRQMGYHVRLARIGPAGDYLAAPDRERIRSLHALWADEEVRGLMAMRGGYGCLRIADRLDLEFCRRHPRWLIGFSDLTVLHASLNRGAGLVTMHGPMVTTLGRTEKKDLQRLFALLAGEPAGPDSTGMEVLRPGIGRGRLTGGNLSCLVSMLGTPWEICWQDTIVLLEDTGEPMYRLDRMLTQLAAAGRLERPAGLLLGGFDHPSGDTLETIRLQEQVWKRVLELTPKADFPVWGNVPAGHGQRNAALPLGMEAEMNSLTGSLTLYPESCLRNR